MRTIPPFVRRLLVLVAFLLLESLAVAQGGRGRGPAGPPPAAKAAAPFDITGYWTSMITQNWRLRMFTPAKGDYLGIPLTAAAKKIADAWDPAKDEASGDVCKAYGAAAIMSLPERLHLSWQDDNTLKMDIDAGTQTRLFHFGSWKSAEGPASRQGDTVAVWIARRAAEIAPSTPQSRYLKATTTHMLAGYLRKNGVPYSESATLTEYFDLVPQADSEPMLIVSTIVEDPLYLDDPLILTAQFKKQPDAAGWSPTPCSVK
jgi:hypothetical protein